jgi:hypothetical protein
MTDVRAGFYAANVDDDAIHAAIADLIDGRSRIHGRAADLMLAAVGRTSVLKGLRDREFRY